MQPEQFANLIRKHKRIFVTGSAGVGKTTILNAMDQYFHSIVKLGSTGMSALLLNGQTLHSFFKIGLSKNIQEVKEYDAYMMQQTGKPQHLLHSYLKSLLYGIDLIIIDEVSMISGDLLDAIYYRLETVDSVNIKMVLSGDLLQLPPVKSTSLIFDSPIFKTFKPVYLTEVKRTTDLPFIDVLHKIRVGVLDDAVQSFINKRMTVKPDLEPEELTRLFSLNAKVEQVNTYFLLNHGEGEIETYYADITVPQSAGGGKPRGNEVPDFFKNSKVQKILEVKRRSKVMFIKNTENFFNGETGIVTDIDNEKGIIFVQKDSNGETIPVMRETFEKVNYALNGGEVVAKPTLSVVQFPLMLSYAISIHKSQGMSIKNLFINCDGIFEDAQFYVAISRATSPDSLFIRNFDPRHMKVNKRVLDFYASIPPVEEEDTGRDEETMVPDPEAVCIKDFPPMGLKVGDRVPYYVRDGKYIVDDVGALDPDTFDEHFDAILGA